MKRSQFNITSSLNNQRQEQDKYQQCNIFSQIKTSQNSDKLKNEVRSHSIKTFQKQNNRDKLNTLKVHSISSMLCPSKNKILNFCCSLACKQNSILCGQSSCSCHKKHEQCFNHFVSTKLIKYLQNVQISQLDMISKIQKCLQSLIDKVSQIRQKVVRDMKQTIKLRMGVNGMFWNSIQSSKLIKGLNLHHFLNKFKNQNDEIQKDPFKKQLDLEIKKITDNMNENLQNFAKFIQTRNNKLQLFQYSISIGVQLNSLILTRIEEVNTLNSFMDKKKFKQLKLLYRASENNFQTKAFWKSCQGIPNTLTIVLTQKQKIVGGYTPVNWNQQLNKISLLQQKDPSLETFLFSLTNRDKLSLSSGDYATIGSGEDWGSTFGRINNADFAICNQANIKASSHIFSQMNFKNQRYSKKEQSYLLFTGQKQNKFKIKQWEVFQVIFQ